MSEGTSEASAAKKRKLGQRFCTEYCIAVWNWHGNIMPIANIANKTFPFITVVGMIVGATSSLKKHVDYSKLQSGNQKVSSFFSSRKGQVSYCHHWASGVCPSVNFSHFNQLLWSHWANLNQTLMEWSLDGPLPKLYQVIPTSNQDGRQAKNRAQILTAATWQWVV
jgi:hypothetical protein